MERLKRKIDDYLVEWKNNSRRLPLIIKGARQIGKTNAIRYFGKNNYKIFIEINFVLNPEFKTIFDRTFDVNEIIKILDTAKVLHLGLCVNNEPYVVPMNYGYVMDGDKLTIYLHGARQGKKLDMMRANPNVFFELDCDIVPFEGDVACRYGITYSSVMGRGKAIVVENMEEKRYGLSVLMKTQTGKDFSFEDRMAEVVSVIRIDVDEYTAKHRPSPVK